MSNYYINQISYLACFVMKITFTFYTECVSSCSVSIVLINNVAIF